MTARRPRICVLGSINMDLLVRAPRLPAPGETLLGGPFRTLPGGKGANQAVAAARLGGSVTMLGAVGRDPYGAVLRHGLAAAGVATRNVLVRDDTATGIAAITVDARGENTIVVAPGANARVAPADVASWGPTIRRADVLALQLEVPLATVVRAAALACRAGVRVLLNAAPAAALPAALLRDLQVLVVNRAEAARLSGLRAGTPPLRMAQRLLARGPCAVFVTLGAEGVVFTDGLLALAQPAFAVRAIDTVGAGDAFAGALAVALGERMPIPRALRFACAAGALATTVEGAQPEVLTRQAVERLAAGRRRRAATR